MSNTSMLISDFASRHLWTFNTHEVYCWNVDKMCIFLSHLQYPCFAYIYKADIFFLATEAGLTLLFSFLLLTNRIRRASVQMKCPSGWKLKTGGVGFLNLITLLIQMFVSQKLDNKPEVLFFFFFFFFFFCFLPLWVPNPLFVFTLVCGFNSSFCFSPLLYLN